MNFNPPSRKSQSVSLSDIEHPIGADPHCSAKTARQSPSGHLKSFKKNFGNTGELWAEDFLRKKGFEILAKNFHTREGEVDLVAKDRDQVIFVEVKARRNRKFGEAIESVSEQKLNKIVMAGERWLQQNNLDHASYRVDVITFDGGKIQYFEGV